MGMRCWKGRIWCVKQVKCSGKIVKPVNFLDVLCERYGGRTVGIVV